ncbi:MULTISPECIES: phytanoyl-CoA dioxygenase family protein [unclassified Sphingomonas]|uniref:phytanoyl-CoA dioxygenase family protein n=1 Tax=unclassified Sphingomonas TaxID=196159 RepID=UPI002150B755|nr:MULTISPECIES: phytanoyl-CoA dioxygenase family protein [unclassified Sphingomonas]MCR5871638.1 phytanoyl-CoA dioxygenase family protein [Sphingomonas sp. J344]UUY00070.1 phytanoyl-CoA dioxygenase family protein [Sphingomonas sp. J315]
MDHVAQYRTNGYAIVRGVFSPDEVARIGAAIDAVHAEGVAHGRSFRHGNLFYNIAPDADGDPLVRMVQWPSYHNAVLDSVRLDPRWVALLGPLIGGDLKQIINQLHWKAPGSRGDFAWHQDSRFRKPDAAYRNLGDSYIQTGLAIDPHTRDSGAMRMIPNSHRAGPLDLDTDIEVLGNEMTDHALRDAGIDPASVVDLELAPGDIAMWSPYLVHGSGRNTADHQRRFYINGYVRAEDCDRGEWAFRDGRPVPLGPEPALVHYEALHEKPEPHYV